MAAGACWPRRDYLVLEAIAAERMPDQMVVRGVERAAIFELRDYGAARAEVVEVLSQRGVRPVLQESGRLLFAFESLAAREEAWRRVSVDPQWIGLATRFDLRGLTVFRLSTSID